MNLITFAFAVITVSLATSVMCDDDFAKRESNCLIDSNVTEDELNAFFHGGMKPADAKDNVKCFIKCFLENEGYMRDGMLVEDAAVKAFKDAPEMIDVPNVEQIVNDCKSESGESDCDLAYNIMMCWENHELNLHK